MAKGAALVDAGRFSEASKAYEATVARCPKFKEAYAGLGHALVGSQRHPDAINAYTKAIDLDGTYPGAYLGRGWIRWFTRDLDGAAADYRQLVRLEPENVLFHFELARVLYELKRPLEVVKLWEDALRRNPDWRIQARAYWIEALERSEAWERLRVELPPLLNEFDRDAHVHYLLGRALNEAREHRAAARELKRAVDLLLEHKTPNHGLLEQYGTELMYAYLWSGARDTAESWQRELNGLLGQAT